MKIYVGNLDPEVTQEELRKEFEAFGTVSSVDIITDKYSGRPRGFAFVEMGTISEGQAAIAGLNEKTVGERTLTVNAARPRTEGSRGGGGFSSRGGDRRGGGGGGFGGGGGGRRGRY